MFSIMWIVLRREMLGLYGRGELPTLDLVLLKVKETPSTLISKGRASLCTLFQDLKFKYKRHSSNRGILMGGNYIHVLKSTRQIKKVKLALTQSAVKVQDL